MSHTKVHTDSKMILNNTNNDFTSISETLDMHVWSVCHEVFQDRFDYYVTLYLLFKNWLSSCTILTANMWCDTLKCNQKICRIIHTLSRLDDLYFNRVRTRCVQMPVACLSRADGKSSPTCFLVDLCINVTPTVLTFVPCLCLRHKQIDIELALALI